MRVDDVEAVGAACLPTRGQGVGVEPKTRKPSVHSSVSGTPCKTAVWGDARRGWVHVDDMEAAVGLRVRQREARAGVEPKNSKIERPWLGFGGAV